ncbi:MAG: hypothetical protein M3Y08_18020, partial [Fibrobacterota bacterium]|nr:hypothetical protein [Fibrobacterota bacterium]
LAHAHRAVRFYGKEHRLEAAGLIGPNCRSIAEKIFANAQHEELAVRRCRHLSQLGRQYGKGPLEIICEMALRLEVESPLDVDSFPAEGILLTKMDSYLPRLGMVDLGVITWRVCRARQGMIKRKSP